MDNKLSSSPQLLSVWVWLCAWLNCAGWALSAFHQLNTTGYIVALVVGLSLVGTFRRSLFHDWKLRINPNRFRWRCRRFVPAIFLLVVGLEWLGGILYAPNNYDALTYRLPRILNWLSAGHWCWIPTINERMNFSGTGWEWLAAPQFALFHSDRGLFLINAIGFLFLPGLCFSVFRQLGVARKVAWTWMWLLPLGYGYATQAGGIGNDMVGGVFCLAAVYYGLRARRSGSVADVWLTGLAAALMTAVKLSNLPLLLPCLVAVWPALPLLRRRLAAGIIVTVVALAASAAPLMLLNQIHVGDWGGDPKNSSGVQVSSPLGALFGNSLQLGEQALLPPVFPLAHEAWNRLNASLPASWQALLHRDFPRYYLGNFQELPGEENAGLGFGLCLTLGFSLLAAPLFWLRGLGTRSAKLAWRSARVLLGLAAGIALLVYLVKMGSEATARLLLPYYPLVIIPCLQLRVQPSLLRFRGWRIWLAFAALSVLPAVIFSPSRPLWPAVTLSQKWLSEHPGSRTAQRIAAVYAGYSDRNDLLKPLRDVLPSSAHTIGWVAGSDDAEYSLWRPFGQRKVVCLRRSRNEPGLLLPEQLEWLVVRRPVWAAVSAAPLEVWAAQHQAQIVATVPIVTIVKRGPEDWCLLHREPERNSAPPKPRG